jgi:aspartate kinase
VFSKWVVVKFGGSSLQDYKAFERSAQIVLSKSSQVVVVLSAVGKTTDHLENLGVLASKGRLKAAFKILETLKQVHFDIILNLQLKSRLEKEVLKVFELIEEIIKGISLLKEMNSKIQDRLLSFGERLSTRIFSEYLESQECSSYYLDVRDIMTTNSDFGQAKPFLNKLKQRSNRLFSKLAKDSQVFVTQGFIGRDDAGNTTTLGRGGSDYTASLIAESLNASHVEIWTDVPGVISADPRYIPQAQTISEITFNEASELAVFGAKVLHPSTLIPAMRRGLPVYVASSFERHKKGTWIKKDCLYKPEFRALSLRENQVLLTISSPEMLLKPGFIVEVFEILAKHQISVDLVSTSEVSISITVNFPEKLTKEVLKEMKEIGPLKLEDKLSLIAVIGNDLRDKKGSIALCFNLLKNNSIKLICQGASNHNICFLLPSNEAKEALNRLHQNLIESTKKEDELCLSTH